MDSLGATQLVAEVGIVVAAFLRQRDRLVGRVGGKGLRGLGHCCSMGQWDIYKCVYCMYIYIYICLFAYLYAYLA